MVKSFSARCASEITRLRHVRHGRPLTAKGSAARSDGSGSTTSSYSAKDTFGLCCPVTSNTTIRPGRTSPWARTHRLRDLSRQSDASSRSRFSAISTIATRESEFAVRTAAASASARLRRLMAPLRRERGKRALSPALQGGGSFGAFTWGVLDRLLEGEPALDMVSGISAGAVNAVLLAAGLAEGGAKGGASGSSASGATSARSAAGPSGTGRVRHRCHRARTPGAHAVAPPVQPPWPQSAARDSGGGGRFRAPARGLAHRPADRRHAGEGRQAAPLPHPRGHARGGCEKPRKGGRTQSRQCFGLMRVPEQFAGPGACAMQGQGGLSSW